MTDNARKRQRPRGVKQTDWLDRLRETTSSAADTNEFMELMNDAREMDMEAIGFRHAAVSTQKRQDRILQDYQEFVRQFKDVAIDITDQELDEICFPPPAGRDEPMCWDALWRLLRPYLFTVVQLKVPRSHAHKMISYTTLCQYRQALLFWIHRKYTERTMKPPTGNYVFSQMTEMIRALAIRFNLVRINAGPDAKVNIGLDDIRQLIDWDVQNTVSIEVSEQHHFAICLARACALRPGSLGPNAADKHRGPRPADKLPYLAWQDIRITNSHQQGAWTLRVTIRNLKTNKDAGAQSAFVVNKTMIFRVASPQQQSNLSLSAPHRLLVIGIRRGVFENISSIEELFDSDLHVITVKPEFLEQPILIAAKPKGAGLVADNSPLPAPSLTKWLQRRAEAMGWPGSVTFYSIRRQSADTYVAILGNTDARALMCHDPDSFTLERFYIDRLQNIDIAAVTLGETIGAGKADEFMKLEASAGCTLDRLPAAKIIQLYGPELNALTRQYIRQDKEYSTLSRAEKKNRDRVLRRQAFLALRREMINLHRRNQTQKERKIRTTEILVRATDFNKRLIQAFNSDEAKQPEDVSDLRDDQLDDDFPEPDDDRDEDEIADGDNTGEDGENAAGNDTNTGQATNIVLAGEQDAEDQTEDRDVTINVPEETDFADAAVNYIEAAADIPYATAAKIAMNLMLSHELGQYRPQGMETCALCEEDDSVDDDRKRHTYTVGHLREHVAGDFHTPYKQWIRRTHQDRDARMAADPNDRDFTCPYCLEAAGDSETFKAMKKLTLHIWRSNSTNIAGKNDWTTPENSAKHDRLKAEAGWYDENWQVNTSSNVKRGTTQRAKTQLAARKIEAQKSDSRKRKFEQPVPVPGQSGIVWAQPGQVVGEDLENPGPGIAFGAAPGSSGYKPSIKPIPGLITTAPPPGSPGWKPTFTKPPRGAYYVARPGTFRNMPGDGHLISDRLKDRHK